MREYRLSNYENFFVLGVSHKKANAEIRGKFSLNHEQIKNLLADANNYEIDGLVMTSTCNRTEMYGFADELRTLVDLLLAHTDADQNLFDTYAYHYRNDEAVSHMFNVAGGLDSQILGDFEIISQMKKSFNLAKEMETSNFFLERLFNSVIQASKRIKNETKLSSGVTSVSFASVHYILEQVDLKASKNILLFGTGKIGRNTCENLVKHTHNKHIMLINRTKEKAEHMAGKFNLTVKDISELETEIEKADILIVATGAQKPTISPKYIRKDKPLLILDLSIPKNVHESVQELPNVDLLHLDKLSKMTDETLENRKSEIPLAKAIIAEIKTEFYEWLQTRKYAPTIKALKQKFEQFQAEELDYQKKKLGDVDEAQISQFSNRLIHKITRSFASHLKNANGSTEDSIALLNKVFELEEKQ
jgi:glutamyl-tRNA reductase